MRLAGRFVTSTSGTFGWGFKSEIANRYGGRIRSPRSRPFNDIHELWHTRPRSNNHGPRPGGAPNLMEYRAVPEKRLHCDIAIVRPGTRLFGLICSRLLVRICHKANTGLLLCRRSVPNAPLHFSILRSKPVRLSAANGASMILALPHIAAGANHRRISVTVPPRRYPGDLRDNLGNP